MHIFYDSELSCCYFNSCPCWNTGTSNLDLKLATIIFLHIGATRVARLERRWIRSWGGNLIPELVWCEQRQHPADRCAWVCARGCKRQARPGVAVTSCLLCVLGHTSWTLWLCERAWALADPRSPGSCPLALEKGLDSHMLHVLCSVPLGPRHGEQDISPASTPPEVTTQAVWDHPFLASVQFPPMDPESTLVLGGPLAAASYTFLSF